MAILNTSKLDKTILAYCLRDVKSLLHCAERITDTYFDPEYRTFYNSIVQYYKRYKQLISSEVVLKRLRKKEVPEEKYRWYELLLQELYEMELEFKQFEFYFDEFENGYFDGILRDAIMGDPNDTKKRGVIDLLTKDKKPKEAWARVKKAGMFIESRLQTDHVERGFFKDSAVARAERYKRVKSGEENPWGILTGYGPLDLAIKGLQGGELLLFAGRPGAGKSANLVAIAKNLYKGIPGIQDPLNVMLFSLEMPRQQYEQRFDAAYTGLKLDDIELGIFKPEDEEIYLKALEEQRNAPNQFYIVDRPGCTPLTVEAELELALEQFDPDVILVDHLSIVGSDEDKGRDDLNQGAAAEGLRRIARERKKPMLSAVQLNRPDKKRGDAGTHRISRSDIIAQTADVVIQIDDTAIDENAQTQVQEPNTGKTMKYVTVKNRKGALVTFQMYCNFAIMGVENVSFTGYNQLRGATEF